MFWICSPDPEQLLAWFSTLWLAGLMALVLDDDILGVDRDNKSLFLLFGLLTYLRRWFSVSTEICFVIINLTRNIIHKDGMIQKKNLRSMYIIKDLKYFWNLYSSQNLQNQLITKFRYFMLHFNREWEFARWGKRWSFYFLHTLTLLPGVHTVKKIIAGVSTGGSAQRTGARSRTISLFITMDLFTSGTITAAAGEVKTRTQTECFVEQAGFTSWSQSWNKPFYWSISQNYWYRLVMKMSWNTFIVVLAFKYFSSIKFPAARLQSNFHIKLLKWVNGHPANDKEAMLLMYHHPDLDSLRSHKRIMFLWISPLQR